MRTSWIDYEVLQKLDNFLKGATVEYEENQNLDQTVDTWFEALCDWSRKQPRNPTLDCFEQLELQRIESLLRKRVPNLSGLLKLGRLINDAGVPLKLRRKLQAHMAAIRGGDFNSEFYRRYSHRCGWRLMRDISCVSNFFSAFEQALLYHKDSSTRKAQAWAVVEKKAKAMIEENQPIVEEYALKESQSISRLQ